MLPRTFPEPTPTLYWAGEVTLAIKRVAFPLPLTCRCCPSQSRLVALFKSWHQGLQKDTSHNLHLMQSDCSSYVVRLHFAHAHCFCYPISFYCYQLTWFNPYVTANPHCPHCRVSITMDRCMKLIFIRNLKEALRESS